MQVCVGGTVRTLAMYTHVLSLLNEMVSAVIAAAEESARCYNTV